LCREADAELRECDDRWVRLTATVADDSTSKMTSSLQLIDEDKNFSTGIPEFLESEKLIDNGLNYHVVSVFGSQSTGKSTLLNALFGTDFNVMNESSRQQTTKGIWMAKSALSAVDSPSSSSTDSFLDIAASGDSSGEANKPGDHASSDILVMDVEGTDGRERGEDQDFERKSALFALATSEVLIVNMWENQVGLYQGANMGLLKTVFEVNLSLFHASKQTPRSMILFVIRDHIGTTPLENLSQTILTDLDRQWESIAKPSEDLKGSNIHDFFDIQFDALPHKVLLPDQFSSKVQQLSVRFTNPSNPSYVFDPKYHRNVPIDGWNMYAEKIWEQIEMNKDLDLPTQQILVARFRCSEIAAQAVEQFEMNLKELQASETGQSLGNSKVVVDGFETHLKNLRDGVLQIYDQQASKYNSKVYLGQRQDLIAQVDGRLSTLFKAQLAALHKTGLAMFTATLKEPEKSTSFAVTISEAKKNALSYFLDNVREVASINPEFFSYRDEFEAYGAELDAVEDARKSQEITRLINRGVKKLKHLINEELDGFFVSGDEKMWDNALNFFNTTLKLILEPYTKSDGIIDFGVGASDETNQKGYDEIRRKSWLAFDAKVKEITSTNNVLSILQEKFDLAFRYDENKVPIVWNAGDDIETPFVSARDKSLELLPKFATAELSTGELIKPDVSLANPDEEEEDDEDLNVDFASRINKARQEEIRNKFKRQADATFVDAKRSTTQTAAQIPFFVIVLLVVLGWNEFMAVLRNPFLFMFCIMVGAAAYITFTLNMWGPLISVADAMGTRAVDIAKEKLRQVLEVSPEHEQRSRIAIPGGGGIELDELKEKQPENE
jgi:hypothetical protein